jgi:hypothetical protein
MADEPTELTDAELESESAETLPDREAMSLVTLPDAVAAPPTEEWGADPIRNDEET